MQRQMVWGGAPPAAHMSPPEGGQSQALVGPSPPERLLALVPLFVALHQLC